MARKKRHDRRRGRRRSPARRQRLQAARRIEAVLDAARGRGRDHFDRRRQERGARPRLLDLDRHGRWFDRLASLDFEYLMSLPLAADPATLRLLLPQSVLGRAQNGHGHWQDERGDPLIFRDATFDRVLTALEPIDPSLRAERVRRERGRRLAALGDWVLAGLDRDELVLEIDGEPLLGVELLRGARVETRGFLRGLVLAGWMDDYDQRQLCMARHPRTFGGDRLELGGGRTHVVRPDRLAKLGIVDPGRGEFAAEDIAKLVELGVVLTEDREYSRPEFDQAYFRLRAAEGVCDDLALIWIGATEGWSAYLGAFVMDAVDTYDKFLWRFRPGGVDGRLARAVQEAWRARHGEELVSEREIVDVIRFGAKTNHPECLLSSSHRRFIQTETGAREPTLFNHWRFVQGDPVFDIELGYNRFPSRKFYGIAHERLQILEIDVPPPTFLRRPDRR